MRCGRDWNGCWRIGCHCCRMWGWGSCSSWLVDRRRHLRCSSRWDGVCCMKYAVFRKWGGGWCSCTWLGREREKRCWQHWTGVWRMRSDWCRKLCGVWCSCRWMCTKRDQRCGRRSDRKCSMQWRSVYICVQVMVLDLVNYNCETLMYGQLLNQALKLCLITCCIF
jgi:hypothetical protein